MGFLLDAIFDLLTSKKEIEASAFIGKYALKTLGSVGSTLPFYNEIKNIIFTIKKYNKEATITEFTIQLGDMLKQSGIALTPILWEESLKIFRSQIQSDLNQVKKNNKIFDINNIYNKSLKKILPLTNLDKVGIYTRNDLFKEVNNNIFGKFLWDTFTNFVKKSIMQIDLVQDFMKIKNLLKRFNEEDEDPKLENLADLLTEGYVELNSSWLKSGNFTISNKELNVGNLSLQFAPQGRYYGTYTYPMVPLLVWIQMKEAPSNCGTLFWKLYLRAWIKSSLRKFIRNKIKEIGIIKQPKDNFENIRKQLEIVDLFVYQWGNKDFTKTKKYQNDLTSWEVGSKSWKAVQQYSYKNFLKQNNISIPKFNKIKKGVKNPYGRFNK